MIVRKQPLQDSNLHPKTNLGKTGIRTNEIVQMIKIEIGLMGKDLILFSAASELMELGLIETGLKHFLARKIYSYVDQNDKSTTCSIVNIYHKSSTTKRRSG